MSGSVAFILFVAAITPGPNNFVVVDVARHGLYATVAPVAGIVSGTLTLIFVVRFGLNVALEEHPQAVSIMRIAGACLLGYLAIRTLIGGWSGAAASSENVPAQGTLFFAMFTFQVVNPKTWVLASAVSATHASQNQASILPLVLLAIIVPSVCLMVWGTIGQMLGRCFQLPMVHKALSTLFSLVFAAFAATLLLAE